MKIWDLLFTSKKTVPPHLGTWYFLLPTSLVIIAVYRFVSHHLKVTETFGIGDN